MLSYYSEPENVAVTTVVGVGVCESNQVNQEYEALYDANKMPRFMLCNIHSIT